VFCKRQGIELVAEQDLASWEGLFFVTLVVIHCNDLTVIMLRMYEAAAGLSAMMKVCTVVITEVILMLCWFYRAALILCTFCQVCLLSHMQQHLMVRVILAIWKLKRMLM